MPSSLNSTTSGAALRGLRPSQGGCAGKCDRPIRRIPAPNNDVLQGPVRLHEKKDSLLTDSIPEIRLGFRSLLLLLASQVPRMLVHAPFTPHTSR
jgi:hypothetical protein